MLKIAKYLFGFVAFTESLLILWDTGGPMVMLTDTTTLEETRFALVLLSLCVVLALHLLVPEESKGNRR